MTEYIHGVWKAKNISVDTMKTILSDFFNEFVLASYCKKDLMLFKKIFVKYFKEIK